MKTIFSKFFVKGLFIVPLVVIALTSCDPEPYYEVDYPDEVSQGSVFSLEYKVYGANNNDPTVFFAGIMLPDGWTVDGDSIIGQIVYKENDFGVIPEPRVGVMYRSNSGAINQIDGKDDYLNNYEALLNIQGGQYPALDGYSWFGYRSQDTVPCPNSTVELIECTINVKVPADAELDYYELQTIFSEQSSLTSAFDHVTTGKMYEPNAFIEVIEATGVRSVMAKDAFTVSNLAGGQIIVDVIDNNYMNSVLTVRDLSGKSIVDQLINKQVTVVNTKLNTGSYIVTIDKSGQKLSQKIMVK